MSDTKAVTKPEIPSPTGDWRDIRHAIEQAVPDYAQQPEHSRKSLWALAEALFANFPRLFRTCAGCGKQAPIATLYRCTDCDSWLHRDCAIKHFGPNHKPHGDTDALR